MLLKRIAKMGSQPPNIVLVLFDDLGPYDLGCYGQQDIKTPNIDALAAGGVRFTNCRAGSPVCSPSRYGLLTGTHAGRWPDVANGVGLRPGDLTVTDVLANAGYRCGLFGKWGLGDRGSGSEPWFFGIDRFSGWLNQLLAHDSYAHSIWQNDKPWIFNENAACKKTTYLPYVIKDQARSFVQYSNEPFFAICAFTLPHANNEAGIIQVPSAGQYANMAWPSAERKYAAAVTMMDTWIGQLVADAPPNTLFIVSADNGAHGEGGHDSAFFGSTGELRERKGWIYDGGLRVPLILYWPGVLAPAVRDEAVWLPDVTATVAAAAGVDMATDGASLLGAIPAREMYFAFSDQENRWIHGEYQQALVLADGKTAVRRDFGAVELYDEEEQLVDVAPQNGALAAYAAGVMDGWL